MKSLAVVTTHPIQYYAPLFQLLAKSCRLKVFYTWGEAGAKAKYDPDFKQHISWDIPLLEDYEYEFLKNTATNPGSHHFQGIVNPDLIQRVQAFKPDAILIYGWSYQSHFKLMRKLKGKIPIWFRGDSNLLDHQGGFRSYIRKRALRFIYSYIDTAFYVGSANKTYYKALGLHQNQLVFAPHAIDISRFSEDKSKEASEIRKQFHISEHHTLILFAGKLEFKKSPILLLEAFLKLDDPTVHLLFLGNGHLEELLKQKAHTNSRVHFVAFANQTQMPSFYQACDLFCLPSGGPKETWGLAVNEAMAAAKAVLVSNKVGCAIDLVQPHINGAIFESDNSEDLFEKMQNLIKFEHLDEMGRASQRIIQNWNFKYQAAAFLNKLYEGH
ncbi:MAG: glycosyltransferase [Pedobacter sp.]|nr:MAG: glycosyltransferase [Pedobacter sp.]